MTKKFKQEANSNQQQAYTLIIVGAGAAGLFAAAFVNLLREAQLQAALANASQYDSEFKPERWDNCLKQALYWQKATVALVDKMSECGKKLTLTGGGRANLSHAAQVKDLLPNYFAPAKFLYPAFNNFPPSLLRACLKIMGIPTKVAANGRIYPQTEQALFVREKLLTYAKRNPNLTILTNQQLVALEEQANLGTYSKGVSPKILNISDLANAAATPQTATPQATTPQVTTTLAAPEAKTNFNSIKVISTHSKQTALDPQTSTYHFEQLLITTGGLSYPQTGSDGSSYPILKQQLGCQFSEQKAGLAPLIYQGKNFPLNTLSGISLKSAALTLSLLPNPQSPKNEASKKTSKKAQTAFTSSGELLITHTGFSGPAALNLARELSTVAASNQVEFCCLTNSQINLLYEQIQTLLATQIRQVKGAKQGLFKTLLQRHFALPERLITSLLTENLAKCPKLAKFHLTSQTCRLDHLRNLTWQDLKGLLSWSSPNFLVGKLRSAQVTVGGLALNCLDSRTFRLKSQANILAAGELLAIDGACGGYNLQMCFATAASAIKAISEAARLS